MKIVNISHTAKLGGAELGLMNLLDGYQNNCLIIVLENGEFVSKLFEAGFNVTTLKFRHGSLGVHRNRWFSKAALGFILDIFKYRKDLLRKINNCGFDLVHVNTIKAALFVGFLKHRIKIPIVWHIRDAWQTPYMSKPTQFLLKILIRRFDGVIANSQFTLNCTGVSGGLVLPSPIKSKHCSWKYQPKADKGLVKILLVGRIAEWKGQEVAIRALSLLPKKYVLRVVGAPLFGENDYLTKLYDLVEELKLNDRVEFIGQVTNVCDQYQWANIAIHTSTTPEPFGQVIIEAMSHGLPVISTEIGGPAEIITNNSNGILIRPNNSKFLSEKIVEISENYDFENLIAINAFEASQAYQHDLIFYRFLDYLQTVLNERKQTYGH